MSTNQPSYEEPWHLAAARALTVPIPSLCQKYRLHASRTVLQIVFLWRAGGLLQCEFNRKADTLLNLQWFTLFQALAGAL